MLGKLQEIIIEMKKMLKVEGLTGCNPDTIIECSTRIFNTQFIQNSKQTTDRKEPITPKQKALLEKLNKYKEGMSKQEAFMIIKELKENGK